jgi:aminoglycoside phosphotransferase
VLDVVEAAERGGRQATVTSIAEALHIGHQGEQAGPHTRWTTHDLRRVHGDTAAGNLLVRDGALAAVVDFGTCGVGHPACDLAIGWTMLTSESRAAFRDRLGVDDATWECGRGWALWKAPVVCAGAVRDGGDGLPEKEALVLEEILTPERRPL